MESPQIDLYEFLTESELQHYYNAIKNELKISNAAQFKYATDEDLKHIGLSRPEIRRLRKFYERHFPHGYLSKIKRLLQTPTAIVKRDEGNFGTMSASAHGHMETTSAAAKASCSPSKVPNNKHIIPADSISVNKQLGTGEFGIVQQGVWTNGTERIQVAIKCLCRERMQSNPMEFLKEAAIMHSIEHENIVRLYGVVLATDSLMLVTELAHLRSLLECLKDSGLRVSFLTIPTLCEFAMQICNGMRYLENKRLIHRDLAARNILVFSKNKVKISDFGLSRALGVGKDYYKTNFNVNLKLPIAWCAPECINYLRFTNASDVWAYGVCIWEMFSYGFQPWAALTGLQILEAIDAPNYQRLEQPDCCPREYYTLMIKCWQDEPAKRPKFSEIYELLPEMKPEQLKAVVNSCEPKKDHLLYRQGEIISVLDRNTGTPFWKGVLSSGKTGYFNPSNTVAYLEGLPSSNRDSFIRVSDQRSSKRKLRTEMISKPQNDFKHTGHVGIDGASFGDVAFLGNSQNYNHVPHQIVTPYKPSEDIEQTPLLLPPTPTSPDSLQTASGYFPEGGAYATSMNPSFVSSTENTPKHFSNAGQSSFEFPGDESVKIPHNASTNPFAHKNDDALNSAAYAKHRHATGEAPWRNDLSADYQHEYHEISDDEITADKLDFGPSLLDEINSMFGSMSAAVNSSKSPDFDHGNTKNEFTEATSKMVRKNSAGDSNGNKFGTSSSKKKAAGTVKPISVKDEKILNHAIEIANEISARSMNDLVSSDQPTSAQSPKRKFSFRFPHLTNNGSHEKPIGSGSPTVGAHGNSPFGSLSPSVSKKKNFTEELKSIPDLQAIIGEDGREAYNSLIERKTPIGITGGLSPAANLLRHLDTNEFELTTAKTLPRRSMLLRNDNEAFVLNQTSSRIDEQQIAVPLQNAPRPMTLPLPHRSAASRVRKAELSATNKNQRLDSKENYNNCNEIRHDVTSGPVLDRTSPCESPSYLSNTFYTFPEKVHSDEVTSVESNPIPLPPRDGKKHIKTNPKRHVRKYPLIIPANGVQRTLNKVTEMSLTDDEYNKSSLHGGGVLKHSSPHLQVVASIRPNNRKPISSDNTNRSNEVSHIYQNIEKNTNEICIDSASAQFESILEADFNKGNVLQSPDVTDGFYNFSIQKEHYNKGKISADFSTNNMAGLYVNEDELRNLDIERSPKVAVQESDNTSQSNLTADKNVTQDNAEIEDSQPIASAGVLKENSKRVTAAENELAANALFKRIRESVDTAMSTVANIADTETTSCSTVPDGSRLQTEAEYFATTIARLTDSNSVSCEDLLEFSDKKPRGCERGVDSDEVRIMMKVLGKDSIPTRCLHVLEFIDWDVHKAIKIIKLQNILASAELNLTESVEVLQKYEWDLHITAMKLRGLKT